MYRGVGIVGGGGDDVFAGNAERLMQHRRVVVWSCVSSVSELDRVLDVRRSVDDRQVELRLGVDDDQAADWVEQCQTKTAQRHWNLVNTASPSHTRTARLCANKNTPSTNIIISVQFNIYLSVPLL